MKCFKCGNEIAEDAVFCPFCGARQDEKPKDSGTGMHQPVMTENPVPKMPVQQPPRKKKAILAIAVILICAAALSAGVFFIAPMIMNRMDGSSTVTGKKTSSADASSVSGKTAADTQSETDHSQATVSAGSTSTASAAAAAIPAVTQAASQTDTSSSAAVPAATPAALTPAPAVTIAPANINDSTGNATQNAQSSFVADTADSYFWPDSNTRYYSESDLDGLTPLQIRYITNEIYAREGYIFKKAEWSNYFSQKNWYHPTIPADQFNDSLLNEYELANVKMITAYEVAHNINQNL